MRVLVCGSRNWLDFGSILKRIRAIGPDVVIEGDACGADRLAGNVVELLNRTTGLDIQLIEFPADWHRFGRSAGVIRNQQMLDEGIPDLVLAFHPNIAESKGTRDMVQRARKAGIRVVVYKI